VHPDYAECRTRGSSCHFTKATLAARGLVGLLTPELAGSVIRRDSCFRKVSISATHMGTYSLLVDVVKMNSIESIRVSQQICLGSIGYDIVIS
jgi:hypothetical protein